MCTSQAGMQPLSTTDSSHYFSVSQESTSGLTSVANKSLTRNRVWCNRKSWSWSSILTILYCTQSCSKLGLYRDIGMVNRLWSSVSLHVHSWKLYVDVKDWIHRKPLAVIWCQRRKASITSGRMDYSHIKSNWDRSVLSSWSLPWSILRCISTRLRPGNTVSESWRCLNRSCWLSRKQS